MTFIEPLWNLARCLDDVAHLWSTDVRTDMAMRMVEGEGGLHSYASKFFLGSMLGLYKYIGDAAEQRAISLFHISPVGPAFEKLVEASALQRKGRRKGRGTAEERQRDCKGKAAERHRKGKGKAEERQRKGSSGSSSNSSSSSSSNRSSSSNSSSNGT